MTISYHSGGRLQGTTADTVAINRGTITTDGSYTIITFTEDGTFTPTSAYDVEYLIVAGGGGGGKTSAGGGGAGGMKTGTFTNLAAGTYSVVVGAGGAGGGGSGHGVVGTNGGDSSINSITSTGGGGGAGYPNAGGNGGSGGGCAENKTNNGTGISGQGYDGGDSSHENSGAGGGGAGAVGNGTTSTGTGGGGLGGVGVSSSISGSAYYYSAGGSGCNNTSTGASGKGGVGSGNDNSNAGNATGYGSGGGGARDSGHGGGNGGDGYQGIVILKFLTSGNTYSSSLGGKPSDVSTYSRFEETDTRKIYTKLPISKTGCLAYYNFEQTTGDLINQATTSNGFPDGLGSSADGTNNGATQTATGKFGNAWSFDGSNDYVNLTANTLLGNNWSFGMWLKGDSSGQTPSLWHFAGKGSADSSEVFNIYDQGGGISYEVQSTGYGVIPTASLDDGQWHYVVITYDGSDMRAYVDNTLEDTHPTVAGDSSAQARDLVIGKRDRGSSPAWFDGLIDEMTIWNRVLTTSEISLLYNSGTGATVDTASSWKEKGTT